MESCKHLFSCTQCFHIGSNSLFNGIPLCEFTTFVFIHFQDDELLIYLQFFTVVKKAT